jgi:hypothetical protein
MLQCSWYIHGTLACNGVQTVHHVWGHLIWIAKHVAWIPLGRTVCFLRGIVVRSSRSLHVFRPMFYESRVSSKNVRSTAFKDFQVATYSKK